MNNADEKSEGILKKEFKNYEDSNDVLLNTSQED